MVRFLDHGISATRFSVEIVVLPLRSSASGGADVGIRTRGIYCDRVRFAKRCRAWLGAFNVVSRRSCLNDETDAALYKSFAIAFNRRAG